LAGLTHTQNENVTEKLKTKIAIGIAAVLFAFAGFIQLFWV
jgi:flagellar basal body-associated protein FliL